MWTGWPGPSRWIIIGSFINSLSWPILIRAFLQEWTFYWFHYQHWFQWLIDVLFTVTIFFKTFDDRGFRTKSCFIFGRNWVSFNVIQHFWNLWVVVAFILWIQTLNFNLAVGRPLTASMGYLGNNFFNQFFLLNYLSFINRWIQWNFSQLHRLFGYFLVLVRLDQTRHGGLHSIAHVIYCILIKQVFVIQNWNCCCLFIITSNNDFSRIT